MPATHHVASKKGRDKTAESKQAPGHVAGDEKRVESNGGRPKALR
jgi:hypothetical protein